jgi:hypothetical protein
MHLVHMGSLEGDGKYGFLLFAMDHNTGVGSALYRRRQGERRIPDLVGSHVQRSGYTAERRDYAVSWDLSDLSAGGANLER